MKQLNKEETLQVNKKKISLLIILLVSMILIIFSSITLINWYKNTKHNETIKDELETEIPILQIDEEGNKSELNNSIQVSDYINFAKLPYIDVNFENLLAKNNNTVGWICINNTKISYPIVQTVDNEYYLTHSFDNSENKAGWIFADFRNNMEHLDNNTVIYGHSLYNKTMFGSLKNILNKSWYTNSNNHLIRMSTQNTNYNFKVFSIYQEPPNVETLQVRFNKTGQYSSFLNSIKQKSIYDFGENLTEEDKILTISTCTSDGKERIILHAKLIGSRKR